MALPVERLHYADAGNQVQRPQMYGAGEVRRYSPAGELTGVVTVDEPEVTCPAFVGPGLDRLLITTRPRLFLADVGAVGLPVTPWAGFD